MIDHFISRVPPQSAYRSPAWKSLSQCKPGAGLKGFSSGGCSWNKKRRDKESQLEAPLEAGRNKDSGCDIVEHFWMYLKLLDSPSISSIPIFNEEHCRAIQKKKKINLNEQSGKSLKIRHLWKKLPVSVIQTFGYHDVEHKVEENCLWPQCVTFLTKLDEGRIYLISILIPPAVPSAVGSEQERSVKNSLSRRCFFLSSWHRS